MTNEKREWQRIWIHHTDTFDGWKEDVIRHKLEHLEREKCSDGFEEFIEAGAVTELESEIAELRGKYACQKVHNQKLQDEIEALLTAPDAQCFSEARVRAEEFLAKHGRGEVSLRTLKRSGSMPLELVDRSRELLKKAYEADLVRHKEAVRVLDKVLEKMEAGFAGMFGDPGTDEKDDAWNKCPDLIAEARTEAQKILKGEGDVSFRS